MKVTNNDPAGKALRFFLMFAMLAAPVGLVSQTLYNENFDGIGDGVTSVSGLIFDPTKYSVQTDTTFGSDKVL